MRKKVKSVKSPKKRMVKKSSSPVEAILLRRVIIIGAFVFAVGMGLLLYNHNKSVPQSVLGASVVRPFYAQSTVSWNPVPGAVSYNIYYKQESDEPFINAVRDIPATITTYTISYLKKGVAYEYKITALDAKGSEFWTSNIEPLPNIESM